MPPAIKDERLINVGCTPASRRLTRPWVAVVLVLITCLIPPTENVRRITKEDIERAINFRVLSKS